MLPLAIKWVAITDGAEVGILSGDPSVPGRPYTIRLRTSIEIRIPPHWQPEDEHLTVLEGAFSLGFGDVFEHHPLQPLAPGAYICIPRQVSHFSLYGAGTMVQVHGIGPFKSIYVNAAEGQMGDRVPPSL